MSSAAIFVSTTFAVSTYCLYCNDWLKRGDFLLLQLRQQVRLVLLFVLFFQVRKRWVLSVQENRRSKDRRQRKAGSNVNANWVDELHYLP